MEQVGSTWLLFEHSLCFKLLFVVASLAILEPAFEDKAKKKNVNFCAVDFDVGLGKQHERLLQVLSAHLNEKQTR